jgi:hypothetical protein
MASAWTESFHDEKCTSRLHSCRRSDEPSAPWFPRVVGALADGFPWVPEELFINFRN